LNSHTLTRDGWLLRRLREEIDFSDGRSKERTLSQSRADPSESDNCALPLSWWVFLRMHHRHMHSLSLGCFKEPMVHPPPPFLSTPNKALSFIPGSVSWQRRRFHVFPASKLLPGITNLLALIPRQPEKFMGPDCKSFIALLRRERMEVGKSLPRPQLYFQRGVVL